MIQKPRKSFRTLLILWFIIFSVVPVAFVTGYSLVRFEQAIDQELNRRLIANTREIGSLIKDFELELKTEAQSHVSDKSFIYYLSNNNLINCREIILRWMNKGLSKRITVFNRSGRLEIAMLRTGEDNIERVRTLEGGDVFLSENEIQSLKDEKTTYSLDVFDVGEESYLGLSIKKTIESSGGIVIGFMEQTFAIDRILMERLKKRLEIELFFFAPGKPELFPDLL